MNTSSSSNIDVGTEKSKVQSVQLTSDLNFECDNGSNGDGDGEGEGDDDESYKREGGEGNNEFSVENSNVQVNNEKKVSLNSTRRRTAGMAIPASNDEEDDEGDCDDDMSFISANTSSSSINNSSSINAKLKMYTSSLEESFIEYAHHQSIIELQSNNIHSDDNDDDDDDLISYASSFSGDFMDAISETKIVSEQSQDSSVFVQINDDDNVNENIDNDDEKEVHVHDTNSCANATRKNNEISQRIVNGNEGPGDPEGSICIIKDADILKKNRHSLENQQQQQQKKQQEEPKKSIIIPSKSSSSPPQESILCTSLSAQMKDKELSHQQHKEPQPKPRYPTSNTASNEAKIQAFTFNQDKNCIAIATSTGYRIRTLPSSILQSNDSKESNNNINSSSSSSSSLRRHRIQVHQMIYPPTSVKHDARRTTTGTTIPNVHNTQPSSSHYHHYQQNKQSQNKSGISHIQILHCTSVIAVVKKMTPRIVSILHAKTAQCILELPFTNAVRRIELNVHTMVVLTADGILHLFHLKGNNYGSGRGSSTGDEKKEKGIEFLQTIPILHSSESTRMISADNAKTTGAFFDLSSHLFTSSLSLTTSKAIPLLTSPLNQGMRSRNNNDNSSSSSSLSSSWLLTKSNEGVGYVSVYKSYSKVIYLTQKNSSSIKTAAVSSSSLSSPSKEPTILKKTKVCMQLVETFQAHKHSIVRIAIGGASDKSLDEKIFATSSLKGTVIRVFNLPQCQILYELHRGTNPSTIYSLSFNTNATLLGVSSSRGTVHIFHLTEENKLIKCSVVDNENENEMTKAKQSKQRWYDPILSSMKKSKNKDSDRTVKGGSIATTTSNPTKIQIVRSIAKIRCERKATAIPNTIAMLPILRNCKEESNGGEDECHVAICFENGKLLVYAIRNSSSSMRKTRPRPILADDIMFDSGDAISR